uniref:G-protein coupled receptors family 1 profile domain-containing protein n=1 Tax=Ascaris lumbricoides TaxID=6252 RepID=A0A9J2PTG2_ASCLU
MRNRANHLLAALAFTDMAVFFLMLPICFAAFSPFYTSISFRIIFGSSKIHLAATANWFSCAAIWIVLAVSIERLLIIKFPFRSLKPYHSFESVATIVAIFLFALALTSYHHVSYKCTLIWLCNMTQVHVHCLPAIWNLSKLGFPAEPPPTETFISYVNISAVANAIIGVIVPVFVVAILNISLIRSLHRRNTQEFVSKSMNNAIGSSSVHEQERKMTITVVAIISYHHVSYKCTLIWLCNMTQVHVHCLPAIWNLSKLGFPAEPPPTETFISYVNISAVANAIIGVIVPVFVVAILNISLIRSLHRRNTQEFVSKSMNNAIGSSSVHEQERKMTITVVAIISCFTITQMPSALLFLYEKLISDAKTETFATVSSITNFLVLTGKMLNVFLFCLTSASFRRKFFATLNSWLGSLLCTRHSGLLVRDLALNRSCLTQKTSLFSSTSPFAQKPRRHSSALPSIPLQSFEPLILAVKEDP